MFARIVNVQHPHKALIQLALGAALLTGFADSRAASYYVAANGSDTNNGTSIDTPLQSLAKAGSLPLNPGDVVLFRRGDVFRGQLNLARSGSAGNPIVLGAYGTGNPPVLTGTVPVSNWTNIGGNFWRAALPGAASQVTGLYSNGAALPLGRWPNLSDTNGGYLTIDSAAGQTQLVSSALSAAPTPNWTGAEVVCRTMQWVLDRATVTSQSGNSLNLFFLYSSIYPIQPGWGFFVQNHVATLDQPGEWCYDNSTHQLALLSVSDPNSFLVEATQAGTVVNLASPGGISQVLLQNLEITGGLHTGLYAHNATNLVLAGLRIINAGENGVVIDGSGAGVTITNCVFQHINNNAITMTGYYPGYAICGCSFTDIGACAGRGLGGDNQMFALWQWSGSALPGANSVIAGNVADGLGYTAFFFSQSNLIIETNVVSNYAFVKDDGGAIYTWNDWNPQPFTNQVIRSNIVYNALGATNGAVNYYRGANGIYMDGHALNAVITGNTVFNCTGHGLLLNNDASNITVTANTVFSNGNQIFLNPRNHGDTITGNYFVCGNADQTAALVLNDTADLDGYGLIDTNWYCRPFGDPLCLAFNQSWQSSLTMSLPGWQSLFGKDLHSASSPVAYPPCLTTGLGRNLVGNAAFGSGIAGWTVYGSTSNNTAVSWDNPGPLASGCLKMNFTAPSGNIFNTLDAFDYQDIFPVTNGSVYLLSFDAAGITNGVLRACLFANSAPWHYASPVRAVELGTNRAHYRVFLPVTESIPDTRLQWQLCEGTDPQAAWVDNVQLTPATTVPVNPDNLVRFEFNPGSAPKAISLAGAYVDPRGTPYSGSLVLQPFTSVVLFKTDPPAAVAASQTAPGIVSTEWSGLPGAAYRLETSTDLVHWTVLASLPAAVDGSFSFADTNASAAAGYYRAGR
ncbi:MAG: right-handed parallel beta-helix repeat-containing protein [Verrucomicrobiota bacterium]